MLENAACMRTTGKTEAHHQLSHLSGQHRSIGLGIIGQAERSETVFIGRPKSVRAVCQARFDTPFHWMAYIVTVCLVYSHDVLCNIRGECFEAKLFVEANGVDHRRKPHSWVTFIYCFGLNPFYQLSTQAILPI